MKYNVEQEAAIRAVWALIADPDRKYLVIRGPAGTGKSEVIREIAKEFASQSKFIAKLAGMPAIQHIAVTATTNKAVDALVSKRISQYLDSKIITTASLIGAKVLHGNLVLLNKTILSNTLIIVDECSYASHDLIEYIEKKTDDQCKIVYLGDPYQLPPPKLNYAPVFDYEFETVDLVQIMRQDKNNPIQQLTLALREFVKGGPWPELVTDNKHLFWIDNEDAFIDKAIQSFQQGYVTKIIGYRNELVLNANAIIKEEIEGKDSITVGDVMVVNSFIAHPRCKLKAESEVVVTAANRAKSYDIDGYDVSLNVGIQVFVPDNPAEKTRLIEHFKNSIFSSAVEERHLKYIEQHWADLRPAYACTIHKSQGSTYQHVFINLDELNGLPEDTVSRLLYVAVSRASDKVYFMGTL